jgi:hypothetical protein
MSQRRAESQKGISKGVRPELKPLLDLLARMTFEDLSREQPEQPPAPTPQNLQKPRSAA